MKKRYYDALLEWAKAKDVFNLHPNTIDLTEVEPGMYRKPEPHEDIHHPDYFDALKERATDLKRNIS